MILFNYFTNLKKWQFIIIRIKKFKEEDHSHEEEADGGPTGGKGNSRFPC